MGNKVRLDPAWHGRRLVVRLTLLSCLSILLYSMYLGPSMAGVVFPSISFLAGSVVMAYVFGASYERANGVPSYNQYFNNDIYQDNTNTNLAREVESAMKSSR